MYQKGGVPYWIIFGILLFLGVSFLFIRYIHPQNNFSKEISTSENNPTPIVKIVPNPDNDLTVKWNTYTDITDYGTGKFSIDYPSTWEQNTEYGVKKVFYPLGKDEKDFIASFGQAGSGIPPSTCEKKTYPGGVANYCWFKNEKGIYRYATFDGGNISYIFRLGHIPLDYDETYEKVFNKMLTTFKKLED